MFLGICLFVFVCISWRNIEYYLVYKMLELVFQVPGKYCILSRSNQVISLPLLSQYDGCLKLLWFCNKVPPGDRNDTTNYKHGCVCKKTVLISCHCIDLLAACLLRNCSAVAVKTTWFCANFMHVVSFCLFYYSKNLPRLTDRILLDWLSHSLYCQGHPNSIREWCVHFGLGFEGWHGVCRSYKSLS